MSPANASAAAAAAGARDGHGVAIAYLMAASKSSKTAAMLSSRSMHARRSAGRGISTTNLKLTRIVREYKGNSGHFRGQDGRPDGNPACHSVGYLVRVRLTREVWTTPSPSQEWKRD
jgi:hypothetical protein